MAYYTDYIANNGMTCFFIVLPGNYYKVTDSSGSSTIFSWFEWH